VPRRGGRGRRSRSGPKDQIWVPTLMSNVAFDNTPVIEVTILSGNDWAETSGLERGTMMTVNGWVSWSRTAVTVGQRTGFGLLYVTDVDAPILVAGTNGPQDALGYVEDILWTGGVNFATGNATAVEQPTSLTERIHVQAMRRLTSDQEIRFAFGSSGSGNIIVSGAIRTLMRRGGN